MSENNYQIRWMIKKNLSEVLEIERESFEFPWMEEEFLCALRRRDCILMVANNYYNIHGFMIYEFHESKFNVINFAVKPEYRRIGIGRTMIDKLKNKIDIQRRNEITMLVRDSNLGGQLFLKSQEFKATNVFRNAFENYDNSNDDGYLMSYNVDRCSERFDNIYLKAS
ncbi:MAG: GNAT family N-acetyltransferase [Nanoarchaeota archaeon]